jgi:hypothetical protein
MNRDNFFFFFLIYIYIKMLYFTILFYFVYNIINQYLLTKLIDNKILTKRDKNVANKFPQRIYCG